MKNESVNTTHINSTVVDMYVQPEKDHHLTQGFDIARLNFTWNVTEYTHQRLHIKMNFTDALAISPLII